MPKDLVIIPTSKDFKDFFCMSSLYDEISRAFDINEDYSPKRPIKLPILLTQDEYPMGVYQKLANAFLAHHLVFDRYNRKDEDELDREDWQYRLKIIRIVKPIKK